MAVKQKPKLVTGKVTSAELFVRMPLTWLSYLMVGFYAYIQSSMGPLMPSLREEFSIGYTVASLHLSMIAGGSVLVGLFGERIARRIGRRGTFWAAASGCALGAAILMISPVVSGTIAAALLIGFCGGFILVTVQANLSELHGARRGIAIAESNVAASSCAVLAALTVGLFARFDLGWRGVIALALTGFALVVVRFRGVTIPAAAPVAAGRSDHRRRLPRIFWLAALVLFLGVGAEWCVGYWGADFLHREAGFAAASSAAAMSAYFVAMAIGRFAGSRLARFAPERLVLVATFVVATIGFLVLWLSPHPVLTIFGLFLTGIGIAGIYPFTIAVAMSFVPHALDLATVRLLFSASFAILSAPFVLGVLADSVGIYFAFGVTLPLLLIAVGLAFLLSRQQSLIS